MPAIAVRKRSSGCTAPPPGIDPDRPVPLVSYGELCVYHRLAVTALKSAGFDWEDVFTGPSFASLSGAVSAGLGVMAITRRRATGAGMMVWEDAPLPKLPDLYSGIYIREGGARIIYEQLADDICAAVYEPADSAPNCSPASPRRGRRTRQPDADLFA